ncbi:hypothetical protein GY45DRAFT_613103 [Cubamyces sp. BRFM 1775]|nr:hypothetical protein GY45DRAFT_613103 [Cubamyces sp. BRFM 1775]
MPIWRGRTPYACEDALRVFRDLRSSRREAEFFPLSYAPPSPRRLFWLCLFPEAVHTVCADELCITVLPCGMYVRIWTTHRLVSIWYTRIRPRDRA